MIPVSDNFFRRGQWGKVSGLYAGDLLFQVSFSSTPEASPDLSKVYWKLDPCSFAISQERTAKVKTGRSIGRIAMAWNSSEPRQHSQVTLKFNKFFGEKFSHIGCSNTLDIRRSCRVVVQKENNWCSCNVRSPNLGGNQWR